MPPRRHRVQVRAGERPRGCSAPRRCCTGTPDAPMCPRGSTCVIANDGVLILCLPTCDPLDPTCPEGQLCVPAPDSEDFFCIFDGSGDEGQVFDPCESVNACDLGLQCVPPAQASECDPQQAGCCLPFCDITLPNTCPGAMQECLPWYGVDPPPPAHATLGICSLPQ